jgi:nitroreductase
MLDLLRTRRSIRKYQNKTIESDKIEILRETLLRSPSSRGINPWEFIFVRDQITLKKLAYTKTHGGKFLEQAPLGIVICGNETKSDVWIEDCSIAAVLAHITAHSIGLGSCWIQIRNRKNEHNIPAEKKIQSLLNLPEYLRVLAIIGIGYPAEEKDGIASEMLNYNKIHVERFDQS